MRTASVFDVLIAEDNDALRAAMRMMLEDAGYLVEEAPDGRAAVEILAAHPERRMVLVLDLVMPGMDGLALLEAISAQPFVAARLAIVVVSAFADAALPGRLRAVLTRLAVTVIAKPFTLEELLAAVAQAAERLTIAAPALPVPGAPPGTSRADANADAARLETIPARRDAPHEGHSRRE